MRGIPAVLPKSDWPWLRALSGDRGAKPLLVDQIVKSVRWEQTMAGLANVEGNKFIELAPGKVLTGLLRKQNRRADILTIDTAAVLG